MHFVQSTRIRHSQQNGAGASRRQRLHTCGSINGTEKSSKGNRELAFAVQSDAAFDYLAALLNAIGRMSFTLPTVMDQFSGPADHRDQRSSLQSGRQSR